MNKFQKLAQLNQDIELLENAGKFEAAEILQRKFVREAQAPFSYPNTEKNYNPKVAKLINTINDVELTDAQLEELSKAIISKKKFV